MTFEELGVLLRTEREKRGLVLDDVASRLKISARVLRALEEADESALPHAVYVRGFIRSYGGFLGLNNEELQAVLDDFEDEELDAAPPTSVYTNPEVDGGGKGGKLLLGLLVLLCVAGGGFFWLYRDADLFSDLQQARLSTAQPAPPLNPREETPPVDKKKGSKAASVETSSAAEKARSEATPSAVNRAPAVAEGTGRQQAASPVGQNTSAASPTTVAARQPEAATSADAGPNGAAQNEGSASAQNRASQDRAGQMAPVTGHHKIIITALAECWIHSNADNSDTRQFSLRKGDTFALTFADKLVLKLGNAGGVRIRYNGEDMPSPGKEGQVRTLSFPPAPQ